MTIVHLYQYGLAATIEFCFACPGIFSSCYPSIPGKLLLFIDANDRFTTPASQKHRYLDIQLQLHASCGSREEKIRQANSMKNNPQTPSQLPPYLSTRSPARPQSTSHPQTHTHDPLHIQPPNQLVEHLYSLSRLSLYHYHNTTDNSRAPNNHRQHPT